MNTLNRFPLLVKVKRSHWLPLTKNKQLLCKHNTSTTTTCQNPTRVSQQRYLSRFSKFSKEKNASSSDERMVDDVEKLIIVSSTKLYYYTFLLVHCDNHTHQSDNEAM